MDNIKKENNPVFERIKQWGKGMRPKMEFLDVMNGKYYPFLIAAGIISNKAGNEAIWKKFVDGIILLSVKKSKPDLEISDIEIENLIHDGFSIMISYLKSDEFSKHVIAKYHSRTDIVKINDQIQTVIDNNSLSFFQKTRESILINKTSILELKKEFLENTRAEYSSLEKSKEVFKFSHLNVKQMGYFLYFLMSTGYEDFRLTSNPEIRGEYLRKLGYSPTAKNTVYTNGILLIKNVDKNYEKIKEKDIRMVMNELEGFHNPSYKMAKDLYLDYWGKNGLNT